MEKAIVNETHYETSVNKNYGKIFVILGKSASGKSSIAKDISKEMNLPQKITYTSRPPREGEINGVDYHFTTSETFETNDFICREQYFINGIGYQNYGVKLSDLETFENIIIVLTPSGYRELKEKFGERVIGIYIMAPRKDRFNRYISRDPNDKFVISEAKRRLETDELDFYEFEYNVEYVVINNKKYEQALEDVRMNIFVETFND